MNDFFNNSIVLENKVALLKPFSKEFTDDIDKIIYTADNPVYTSSYIKSKEELEKYVEWTLSERKSEKSYSFIIIDKLSNRVAGSTRYGNIDFTNKRLEIGWTWIGNDFRGTVLNKACKYELLKYAFENLHFNRVQFCVKQENIRSQKAVLKLGAKQEGIFRNNSIDKQGNIRGDVYFSIISDEWPEIKKVFFKEFIE